MTQPVYIGGDSPAIRRAMSKVLLMLGYDVRPFPNLPNYNFVASPELTAKLERFDYAWWKYSAVPAGSFIWCTGMAEKKALQTICACCRAYGYLVGKMESLKLVVVCPADISSPNAVSENISEILIGLPGLSRILKFLDENIPLHSLSLSLSEYRMAMASLFHDFKNGWFWTGEIKRNNDQSVKQLLNTMKKDMQRMNWEDAANTCERTLSFTGDTHEPTELERTELFSAWSQVYVDCMKCD